MKTIIEILNSKKNGIDCTEEESAEIKMYLKEDITGYLRNYNNINSIYGELWEYFPAECSEACEESELTDTPPFEKYNNELSHQ